MKLEKKSPTQVAEELIRLLPPEVVTGLVVAASVLAGVWFVAKHVVEP